MLVRILWLGASWGQRVFLRWGHRLGKALGWGFDVQWPHPQWNKCQGSSWDALQWMMDGTPYCRILRNWELNLLNGEMLSEETLFPKLCKFDSINCVSSPFPSLSPQCWLCATARGHKAPVCKSHRCNRGDPSQSTMPSSGASWGGKKTPVKSAIEIPPSSFSQCHCWFSDQQNPNPTNCHVPAILSITPSMHLPIQCNLSINSGGTVPTSCMYPWVSWGLKKR